VLIINRLALVQSKKESNDLPNVSDDFIHGDHQFLKTQKFPRHKKGGPYSKSNRLTRRKEVYRLHFEYGYSASKIADLLQVNRNTINGDLDYWYSQSMLTVNFFDPSQAISSNLQRMDIQRTRLREELDKAETFQEKLALERLILEIDSKILNIHNKLVNSTRNIFDLSTEKLNEWLKKHKKDERYLTLFDKLSVSSKAYEKISKIIEEDRLRYKSI